MTKSKTYTRPIGFTMHDIIEMNKTKPLYIKWVNSLHAGDRTTPESILYAVRDGRYNARDFDQYAYCIAD